MTRGASAPEGSGPTLSFFAARGAVTDVLLPSATEHQNRRPAVELCPLPESGNQVSIGAHSPPNPRSINLMLSGNAGVKARRRWRRKERRPSRRPWRLRRSSVCRSTDPTLDMLWRLDHCLYIASRGFDYFGNDLYCDVDVPRNAQPTRGPIDTSGRVRFSPRL